MQPVRDTPRIQLWSDWLLLAAGFVILGGLLDLVADAVYHNDGTVLYWLEVAYSYPDGMPEATFFGLTVLALALLAGWGGLRLLARYGLAPARALAGLVLTVLATISAAVTLLLGPLLAPVVEDGNSFPLGPAILGFGLLTAALILGLVVVVRGAPRSEPGARRKLSGLLGPLALVVVMTLLTLLISPVALLIGEGLPSYIHLASTSYQDHRYYLAFQEEPSEGSAVVLYRCDTLGVWCQQIDTLAIAGDGQSDNGRLRYDSATQTVTASEGDHQLLAYPAGDLFGGP